MPERYDVIIIGTGAGGGTLAHTLAPTGKKILLLGARRLPPARAGELGPGSGVHRRSVHLAGHLVRRDGKSFQPQVHYFVGGATKMYGAALVPAPPAGLRRAEARRRHLARVAALLRRLRALVHEGRVALPGARQPRRGPDRRPLEQAVPVARGVARAEDPAALRRPGGRRATTRSTRRAGSCSTRPIGRGARASAAPGATATRAWSTRSPTRRRSPSGPILGMPNVTLLVNAEVVKLETDPTGRTVTGVVVDRDGDARDVRGRHRRRSPPGRRTARRSCSPRRTTQHPNGLANGSDQVGRNYMFHNSKAVVALVEGAERHRVPEDARR